MIPTSVRSIEKAREIFAQCEEAANCHLDNAAEAAECVIAVIAAALDAQVERDAHEADYYAKNSTTAKQIAKRIRQQGQP